MFTAPNQAADDVEMGWANAQLGDAEYEFLCDLIYKTSRINLGSDKRVLVASRLAKRLRERGLKSFRDYCDLLRSPAAAEEMEFLINRISTNHTNFFREIKHFDFMQSVVIPQWRAEQKRRSEPYRIWSAASSTGEEAYSIAIQLAESFAPAESGRWQIEASDISTRVLEVAQRGVYESDRLSGVSSEVLQRHFQRGTNKWAGHFRVKDELRRRVNFQHLNLFDARYPFAFQFDLIFCRNVMIYFDRPTQEILVGKLADKLLPGAHLLVGHSESLSGVRHPLRLVQPAIYQRPVA
jgi:chemotaxis protein methyltransferase CheR